MTGKSSVYEPVTRQREKANKRVRECLKASGLHQWELAFILGMGESTLIRHLRKELPEEEQDKIIKLIKDNT